jgi:hypothetical protein
MLVCNCVMLVWNGYDRCMRDCVGQSEHSEKELSCLPLVCRNSVFLPSAGFQCMLMVWTLSVLVCGQAYRVRYMSTAWEFRASVFSSQPHVLPAIFYSQCTNRQSIDRVHRYPNEYTHWRLHNAVPLVLRFLPTRLVLLQ